MLVSTPGSRRNTTVLWLAALASLAACERVPTAPADVPDPAFAAGGVPGPPTDVTIPAHIGPPPHARIRIPPHAGPPSFLANMTDVGAGFEFSCAVRGDGAAFCWGANTFGQLGDGTMLASAAPVRVNTAIAFARIFVGDDYACGLEADGTAHCWGRNDRGQLGAGLATPHSLMPVPVAAPHRFSELSTGLLMACGMAVDDGLAYCWGSNTSGRLGVGSPDPIVLSPMPVVNGAAIGLASVNTSGLTVTCGLAALGDAYCWGFDRGLFGNGSTANPESLVPVPAASGARFASIHAAHGYVCGLDAAGHAFCWGTRNDFGEMGLGSTIEPVLTPAAVVGGHAFASFDSNDTNRSLKTTCGVTAAGEGWCWGANAFGQLGAASSDHCAPAGPPFSDACSTSPILVDGGIQWARITMGADHTCGVAVNGAAYCWGRNHAGQLGDGTMIDRAAPVRVRTP